jgi:hypothetical protein
LSPFGGRAVAVSLLATLLAAASEGGARLEVAGEVVATTPRLEVRVLVSNGGDATAMPLEVAGELAGERRRARVVAGVGPGEEAAVVLDFATAGIRPGRHVLTLLLEYPVEGARDAAGNPPVESQWAFVILAIGARPGPAVRVGPADISVDVRSELPVTLESLDGRAHEVRLRVLPARGLRVPDPVPDVKVPAQGSVSVAVPLMRSGAPRGSHHEVLIVAEPLGGTLEQQSVALAAVDVAPDPALLPRIRVPLLGLALALLFLSGFAELRRRRRG